MLFCQDKEIGVEAMERKRIEYIDWLRIISAIAVIGIHITMTQPNNYSVQEIGKSNYTILTCVCIYADSVGSTGFSDDQR